MTANIFTGSWAEFTNLNVSNSGTATQQMEHYQYHEGGQVYYFKTNQILIGSGSLSFSQSADLTWNNATNNLSATNFVCSGSALINLNASTAG
jgi:hypothetical protein